FIAIIAENIAKNRGLITDSAHDYRFDISRLITNFLPISRTWDNTRRIDEKLDCINEKVNRTSLDVELHNETLMKLLPTLASLVDKFIWPMMLNDVAGLRNKQDQLQKIYSSFNSQPTSNASINTPNNETDQNMSR
ncbi:unnamed protein product, partial [Rotaria socialis]